MGIYIKGMEMPEFGEKIIVLTSSGYVEDVSGQVIEGVEAVPVPPHGEFMNEEVFDCVFNWWTGFAGKETCEAGYLDCKEEDCPMYQKAKEDELDGAQETERINNGSL